MSPPHRSTPAAQAGRGAWPPGRRDALRALAALAAAPVWADATAQPQPPTRPTQPAQPAAPTATGAVPAVATADALPRLKRGFNLAHWFEYERTAALTAAELQDLADWGLDHVRLPLDPQICGWRPEAPDLLPFLADLTRVHADCLRAGLTLVLDLHIAPEHKGAFETEAPLERALARLWQQMARHFVGQPRRSVAFELFNEPQFYGVAGLRWSGFSARLHAAVREVDAAHRVLLSGPRGGSLEALLETQPVKDAAAAYTFHYYEPFVFTHQAIPWLDPRWTAAGTRADVLYPAERHRGVAPRTLKPHPKAREEWDAYIATDWKASVIHGQLAAAAQWSRQHGVPVACTEFGAIRAGVEPTARYRWLADVRTALESLGLGWTVWDYTHIFGLTVQSAQPGFAGRRSLDAQAPAALGLVRRRS